VSIRTRLTKEIVNSDFVKKIEELSGQNLMACFQCGKCSAGCPLASAMDKLPNEIIRLAQLGQEEDIYKSKTIWLCASCFTCASRCPKGVDLSKVMEAIRTILLRKGYEAVEIQKLDPETLEDVPQQLIVCGFKKMTG
jgi:heterodisulfide reductase subunit C